MGRSAPPGPGAAWLSLAATVGAVKTKEQVGGPSQPSHHGRLHWGALGLRKPLGGRMEAQTPPPAPPAPPEPCSSTGAQSPPGSSPTARPRVPRAQDTHVDTRWRPRPCRGPTGGPGRRAGSARSLCPWCCAGRGTPAGPPHRGRTHSRAHDTCTWERTRRRWSRSWASTGRGGLVTWRPPHSREPLIQLWGFTGHRLRDRGQQRSDHARLF